MTDDLSAVIRHPEKLRSACFSRFQVLIAPVDEDTTRMF